MWLTWRVSFEQAPVPNNEEEEERLTEEVREFVERYYLNKFIGDGLLHKQQLKRGAEKVADKGMGQKKGEDDEGQGDGEDVEGELQSEQQDGAAWFSAQVREDLADVTVDSLLQSAEDIVLLPTDFVGLDL